MAEPCVAQRPAERVPREVLPVFDRRRCGVLLHLSSLDAPLGRGGRAFIDWLASGGFSVWQVLPLGPTGPSGSPYWVRSDFAGNTAFIDADERPRTDGDDYRAFLDASRFWLEDYALFEVLGALHSGQPWWQWRAEFRDRDPAALARLRSEHAQALARAQAEQFVFTWQWQRLRAYAHERGVRLFGDVPFYVAPDSAEVWTHRDQFQLDPAGLPRAVAGVPPDYFSELGQLWGNPLYEWARMRRDGFVFWRARVRSQLERVDLLRIDHFRALAAHWAVPAGAPDARGGAWRRTPGRALLKALQEEFVALPLVAEDLGLITPDVEGLRRRFRLPGMRVLQFGFDGNAQNPHLPHMLRHNSVCYTGTHDNDTTSGWFAGLDQETQRRVESYLGTDAQEMPLALVRAACASVATLAIVPLQDLLGLGSEGRLNTPGTTQGNWGWKVAPHELGHELAQRCAAMNQLYGRA
jgi:4-alpha-glucanotransferase